MRRAASAVGRWPVHAPLPRRRPRTTAASCPSRPIGRRVRHRASRCCPPMRGKSIAATEDIRRGFIGLAIRPNAYAWSLVGEREVLAPLNGNASGWPDVRGSQLRAVGPVARERPLGRALGGRAARRGPEGDRGRRCRHALDRLADPAAALLHHPAEERLAARRRRPGAPLQRRRRRTTRRGRAASRANVFDPVAAGFYFVPGRGSGWRRESYDVRSLPLEPSDLRKLTSTDELLKGH